MRGRSGTGTERAGKRIRGCQRSQTGTAALRYTRSTLNEGRDRGGTKYCSGRCSDRICQQRAFDTRELSILIQHICLGSHTDQSSQRIENVYKQKRKYDNDKLQNGNTLKTEFCKDRRNALELRFLLKNPEAGCRNQVLRSAHTHRSADR